MPKPLDTKSRLAWRGTLYSLEHVPIDGELLKRQALTWVDGPVAPENARMTATVANVRDSGVAIRLRGGKIHLCPFHEIIAADAVLRYWLAQGKVPVQGADFRQPDPAIGVSPIYNDSYAPTLSERLRREAFDAIRLLDNEASGDGTEYCPTSGDRRRLIERQIRERRGQRQFRDALRRRYGDRCLVTGCAVLAVLEAAHISPYRGDEDHHPENGLLLRSDVHTLFDLDLVGIEPDNLRVELHADVAGEYGALSDVTLSCLPDRRPSLEALRERYQQFRRRLDREP